MANNNQIYKMSNAGGFKSLNRYYDMLAGNTTWNPWEPQGAFDALASIIVPSGGAATITFSGIPTGYKHLQIRGNMLQSGTGLGSEQALRFNADSGNNYAWHQVYGDGTNVGAGATTSTSGIGYAWSPESGTTFASVIVDILDYSNTTKNTTTRSLNGWDRNGSGYALFRSGFWNNTAAVTSITLSSTGANYAQYSSFFLYGVK